MRRWHEAASGEVQVGHEEKIIHLGAGWSLEQAPGEVATVPDLSELTGRLDDALSHMV